MIKAKITHFDISVRHTSLVTYMTYKSQFDIGVLRRPNGLQEVDRIGTVFRERLSKRLRHALRLGT